MGAPKPDKGSTDVPKPDKGSTDVPQNEEIFSEEEVAFLTAGQDVSAPDRTDISGYVDLPSNLTARHVRKDLVVQREGIGYKTVPDCYINRDKISHDGNSNLGPEFNLMCLPTSVIAARKKASQLRVDQREKAIGQSMQFRDATGKDITYSPGEHRVEFNANARAQ